VLAAAKEIRPLEHPLVALVCRSLKNTLVRSARFSSRSINSSIEVTLRPGSSVSPWSTSSVKGS